ncbi:MAG: RNA polymerase sigma factor [Oscillospiraceae bacterium]|nr:RNA polymerase sigma factor [Oscillospiraceae bacterium]
MDDVKIIELLWVRAEKAISVLTDRFGPRLYTIALNILSSPSDAEESVNDTYFAIWNAIPPNRPEPLAGYVYRTGRNLALKKRRSLTAQKRNSAYDLSLEELSGCVPSPALEETADARALGRTIDRWLDTQTKTNRAIFLRRYWFGDSAKEIAAAFGLRVNAVEVRLSRMRSKLKGYLIEEGHWYE